MVSIPLRPSFHCASTATTRPRTIATASRESSLKSADTKTVALAAEQTHLRTMVIKTVRMSSPRSSESLGRRVGSHPALQAYDAQLPILGGFAPLVLDRLRAKPFHGPPLLA